MLNKDILRPALTSGILFFGTALASAGAAELGGGQLETRLSARVDYDSNIFLNNSDVSDTVGTAAASVNYARDIALVAEQLSVGATGSMFFDHSRQNSVDPFAHGSLTYTPSDKTVATGSLFYDRSTLANEQLNTRTKSDEIRADGSLQNLFSEKLGYRVIGNYRYSNFLTSGYADVYSYSLGASGVYAYSPKLTSLLGYTHRESWTSGVPGAVGSGPASTDDRFDVGFEGELAPKVSGTFHIGWQQRSFDSAALQDRSALYLSTGLKWIPRQKTTVNIDASRDFDTTAARQSVEMTSLSVGVRQVIDSRWSVDGSVAVSHSKYDGSVSALDRTDDSYRLKARATYEIATNIELEVALGYGNVDSTNIFSTYERVNAGVGITATF